MAIQQVNVNELPLEETVVKIYRCSKVVPRRSAVQLRGPGGHR